MTQVGGLESDVIQVVPGETTTCGFTVRNTSTIVEEYTFQVGDEVRGWTEVEPTHAYVHPGAEQRVTITFRPPRLKAPAAGELVFRLYVTPVEVPESQVVAESTLRVLPLTDLTAEVVPRTSTSSVWGGRHDIAVDNRGNTPVELRIDAVAPDRQLVIDARPATLTVRPGEAEFIKVRARPSRLRWLGRPVSRPYQITVIPEAVEPTEPLVLDATMLQRPVVPAGTVRVLAGVIALALLGVTAWYGALRPATTSTAQEAVRDEVASVAEKADQAQTTANKAAAVAQGESRQNTPRRATPAPTPPAGPGGIPPGATLFNERLATESGVGVTAEDQYSVPNDATLIITFLGLQNPWGARGSLELIVDGQTVFTEEQAYYRSDVRYFPTPIQASAGSQVIMRSRCTATGSPPPGGGAGQRCRAYVLIGGYLMQRTSPRPS